MNPVLLWLHKLGSPPYFYRFAARWQPWLLALTVLSMGAGLWYAWQAPADYLQGQSAKILYIHMPSAGMSLLVYGAMAIWAVIALVWHIKLAETLAMCAAPIGAAFTAITLLTGMLWGRPTWGTYWVWDARLTSELVLLFLYFGVIGLHRAIEEPRKAARAACLLILVGVVNLPIIRYSVVWWNTLHQGPSVSLLGTSGIDASMLPALLLMVVATHGYFGWSLLARARVALLEQDSGKDWVRAIVAPAGSA